MALLILVVMSVLLIWKFGFLEKMGRPPSLGVDAAVAPIKVADPVVANSKTCLQLPIQIGEGDFSPVENTLTCVLNEYTNAAARKDKKRILALDYELKELVYAIQVIRNHDAWNTYWQNKDRLKYQYHSIIGVYIHSVGFSYDWGLSNDRALQSRIEALAEYDQLMPRFDKIRNDFLAIPKIPVLANIENFYELDEQLEKLLVDAGGKFDGTIPLPNFPEIGVNMEHGIHYSGTIRQVADKLLPPQGFVDPKTGIKIKIKGDRFSNLKGSLEAIYLTYKSLKLVPDDAEKLYELSDNLGKLVEEINKNYPGSRSQIFWDNKFKVLGLSIGHYSDQLEYSKILMAEAHQLNPNSKYRSYTLFTEIYKKKEFKFNDFPDIEKAMLYLKEYPNGPYVTDVNNILAGFYHDLYAALRERELVPMLEDRGVTYDCYDEYIDSHPEEANQERARKLGISYFEKVIANIPLKDHRRSMYLDELDSLKKKKTDNVINVCGH